MEVPQDLADAGRALWVELTEAYELSPAELVLLAEVAHVADELETLREASRDADVVVAGSTGQLKVHPLFEALRAHRLLLSRLLGDLALPADFGDVGLTPRQLSAKKAAESRWAMEQQRWGKGGKTA